MTTSITRRRVRMKADALRRTSEKMNDVFTSSTPELWRGNDLQIEIGLFANNVILDSISNLQSLTIEVKAATARAGAPLITKTITSLDGTCDTTSWADGSKQHALVVLTGAETNVDMGSANELACWLVVSVITTTGENITIQTTDLKIVEDGTGTADGPQDNSENYFTKDQADARYLQNAGDGYNYRISGGNIYWYEPTTALWYPLVPTVVNGQVVFAIGQGVAL